MSIAFAPRFARAATPAVKRCFATNGALMSFQRAPQSTTPAKSTTEAPRAPSPNPLQSSHAQGGSASTSSSLSPEESSSSDFSSNGNGSGSLPTDWSTSFSGLGSQPFDARIAELLTAPIDAQDVEIKPDGIIFLPEIKYRRVLNRAFGPGGWGLAPRGPEKVDNKTVSREYALVCMGQLVAIARGENDFFDPSGVATATEGCKSNALMRCCKDLGIASELWDPRFIRTFKANHAVSVFATNTQNNTKKRMWRRKDDPPFGYPWKE